MLKIYLTECDKHNLPSHSHIHVTIIKWRISEEVSGYWGTDFVTSIFAPSRCVIFLDRRIMYRKTYTVQLQLSKMHVGVGTW